MEYRTKEEILHDFTGLLDQIDKKPSDEIEYNLQKIIHHIRPLIHKV